MLFMLTHNSIVVVSQSDYNREVHVFDRCNCVERIFLENSTIVLSYILGGTIDLVKRMR